MRSKLPSPAMIVALLALAVALGGTTYAAKKLKKNSVGTKQLKKNAVTTAKIKKGAVTGAKIENNAITTAKIADGAVSGAKVNAGSLGTVPNATNAQTAQHAQTADAIPAPEAMHLVGEPGEPPFAPTWENLPEGAVAAAFYKDREGVVHLQGIVGGDGTQEVVFTLPPAYRPAHTQAFPALGNGGVLALINVGSSGEVISSDEDLVNLNGITFRAES
jgi:hypothetical protein